MIQTHSKFIYGYEVTSNSRYFDFEVSGTPYSVIFDIGAYSAEELRVEFETKLNDLASGVVFSVSLDRSTRLFTVTGDSAFDYLPATGPNSANNCAGVFGFDTLDDLATTSVVSTQASGAVYTTQFKLQDYVDEADNRMSRFATVHKSSSGATNLIRFGEDRIFEMNFRYITDRPQPSNGPIRSNTSGVQDFRDLMSWGSKKYEFEFLPDESDGTTFYRVVLESTPEASDGTGYKLKEQYQRGLVGYYDSGIIRLRVIED